MDRTIILAVPAPIPHGHRVEVVERVDDDDQRTVLIVTDLDTRIRYQQGSAVLGTTSWMGRVRECTILPGREGVRTSLLIDPVTPGADAADVALREADAAAFAVTSEALRWGGAGRKPEPDAPRFW